MRPRPESVAKGWYWDSTFSPYIGCTPCSPGCDHCWARRQEDGRLRHLNRMKNLHDAIRPGNPYFHHGPVYQGEAVLEKAKRMKGVVFAGFRTDLFHEALTDNEIVGVLDVLWAAPTATFIIATKRAARMRDVLDFVTPILCRDLAHIRFGVSVCNQAEADAKLPHLKAMAERGLFTWASLEPMLGPIDLSKHLPYLKWVVVGGETGKGARPMDPDWARSVRDQCKAAGTPFWFKQMSKKAEIPADLMVRQWDKTDLVKG